MKKKLFSNRGETLVEVMASLLVVVLIIAMLPIAIETAARINASVKDMETICPHTMSASSQAMVTAKLFDASGVEKETLSVRGYQENGFIYYVGN